MSDRKSKRPNETAQQLSELLDGSPDEETIHQFFKKRVFRIGHGNPRFSEQFILGAVSKFPVTPDRIPDFTLAFLNVKPSQRVGRISFVEFKKPSAFLYTGHARMSKDLNDAWMECIETSRLIADNFRDFSRRLVKVLDEKRLPEFDGSYDMLARRVSGEDDSILSWHGLMPWCNSVIVIGRRSSLDSEGFLRTIELSASTGRGIQVITYDTVLDWLSESDEIYGRDSWKMFFKGWFW